MEVCIRFHEILDVDIDDREEQEREYGHGQHSYHHVLGEDRLLLLHLDHRIRLGYARCGIGRTCGEGAEGGGNTYDDEGENDD